MNEQMNNERNGTTLKLFQKQAQDMQASDPDDEIMDRRRVRSGHYLLKRREGNMAGSQVDMSTSSSNGKITSGSAPTRGAGDDAMGGHPIIIGCMSLKRIICL